MASTRITVNDNGSLKIEGDFEIVDKDGAVYDLGGRESSIRLPLRTLPEQTIL